MAENWKIKQKVDLSGPGKVTSWPETLMMPGDSQAHEWSVEVTDNNVPVSLTGWTVTGYFDRADGETVAVVGSVSGNTATVTMEVDCYTVPGAVRATMRMAKSTAVTTLSVLLLNIGTAPGNEYVDPGEVIPTLATLAANCEAAAAAASAVATTSAAGLAPQATAPAAGLRNILGIDSGETGYANKALYDTTAPSTQAYGDSAAVGIAMTAARRDHKHAMPNNPAASTSAAGLAPQAIAPAAGLRNVLGIDNAETGYANKPLFDATVPSAQAFGDTASVGTAMAAARRDHRHAMPAVVNELSSTSSTSALSAAQGKALNDAKANKAASPTAGNVATLDADGNPTDGGTALSDVTTQLAEITQDVTDLQRKVGTRVYGIRWDKANAQCTRFGDASTITTTITNFAHRGSVNANYANPFDAIYPWRQRKLCKVNRTTYKTIRDAGGDILGAVTMWEGENGFALDGTGDFDGVYTPEFWGYIWQDATYVYAAVADGYVQGWTHFPATIGGRYPGSLDANAKMTSIANSIAWRGSAISTMHANAVTQGMTLDDIYTWAAETLLLCVEYATLNTQTAVGNGCDSLYSAGATGSEYRPGAAAALGATALIIPNALATALAVGGVIDVGTSNEGANVCYVRTTSAPASLDAADPLYATHKSVAVTALPAAVTTAHYLALHGCYNAPDSDIGSNSGYIGTSGKCNAYYRGRVAHGNYWRYVLGAYRQTGTNRIWVAHSRAEANAYDALNTVVHRDTGLVLPTGAEGAAVSGYINSLLIDDDMPLAPFGGSIGGSNANPVGDYLYVPTPATANTVLLAGAAANFGTPVGRFFGSWYYAAGYASWAIAALPFLIAP